MIFIALEAGLFAQTDPVNKDEYRDIYPDTWVGTDALGRVMPVMDEAGPVKKAIIEKMAAEGNKVLKMCFWAFNGPVMAVVQFIYDRIYKPGRFKNLWFYWEGKPLLIYNATGV